MFRPFLFFLLLLGCLSAKVEVHEDGEIGQFWQLADPHVDYFYEAGSPSSDFCHATGNTRKSQNHDFIWKIKQDGVVSDDYDAWCTPHTEDLCGTCSQVVCLFQTEIEEDINETSYIESMIKVCKRLPEGLLRTTCELLVERFGESITGFIDALDPNAICRTIDICSKRAGKVADYYCSPSGEFLADALEFMKNTLPEPDFIVLNGDFAPQTDDPTKDFSFLIESIANVTEEYIRFFPSAPVVTTIGNHDVFPMNDFEIGGGQLLKNLSKTWSPLIPPVAMKSFQQNGFYSIVPSKVSALKLISLNTNLWSFENSLVNPDVVADPGGMLAWFRAELADAKESGQRALVVGHIPPGMNERFLDIQPQQYYSRYTMEYLEICKEYSDIIVGQLFGHEHSDAFRLISDEQGTPISTVYVTPSLSPKKCGLDLHRKPFAFGPIGLGNNPTVRLWKYNRTNGDLLDYTQYFVNLDVSNYKGKAEWREEYSAKNEYDLASLEPKEWAALLQRWDTDDKSFQRFFHFLSSNITLPYCDDICKFSISCAALYITYEKYTECISDLSLSISF